MVDVARRSEVETLRAEVREWLEANWNEKLPLVEWRRTLLESGWGMPMWPAEWWGKGFAKELARVVAEEFERAGATGLTSGGIGAGMAAPTILAHGNDEQRRRYIPKILTGEEVWCQLFSEPGAGSDVASSQTRAERHGDEWVVNGQKVWTSGAQAADLGLLLARTDWDVPKHEGLTYFVIPMKQPGVDVRPLKQMTGGASFNEVFFTDARMPLENLLGEEGAGWAVAVTTLMNERVSIGGGGVRVGSQPVPQARDEHGGARDGGRREAATQGAQARMMRFMMRAQAGELAKQLGRTADPLVRQQVATLYMLQRIAQWNNQRSRAAEVRGVRPGPEGSLAKLTGSNISRVSANVNASILGAQAMLIGPDAPYGGAVAQQLLGYHSSSIAGGTDDIQKNIVGERVLGLPKDIQVDAGVPFREVRVSKQS